MEFASQRQAFTTIYVFSFDLYGNSPRMAGIGSHIRSVHQISKSSHAREVVGLGLEPNCPADRFVYCLCGAAHPPPRPEITVTTSPLQTAWMRRPAWHEVRSPHQQSPASVSVQLAEPFLPASPFHLPHQRVDGILEKSDRVLASSFRKAICTSSVLKID